MHAQGAWPNRPVRVIVPWPPGGSTDVLVRLYAEQLSPILGQPFVVENRAGAGGNIGLDAVAKSAADGYTMGIASVGHLCINPVLYARLAYDPVKDLMPVGVAWDLPNVAVVASEKNPSKTLAEFITWAKAKPNGITYGSPGVGTTPHLSGALFCARTGIEGTHVPFRGAAQTVPAILSGDVDFALDNLASYVPTITGGQMRGLGVTTAERWPTMTDIPTMAEAGLPNFVLTSWQGFVFPTGTPARGDRADQRRAAADRRAAGGEGPLPARRRPGDVDDAAADGRARRPRPPGLGGSGADFRRARGIARPGGGLPLPPPRDRRRAAGPPGIGCGGHVDVATTGAWRPYRPVRGGPPPMRPDVAPCRKAPPAGDPALALNKRCRKPHNPRDVRPRPRRAEAAAAPPG